MPINDCCNPLIYAAFFVFFFRSFDGGGVLSFCWNSPIRVMPSTLSIARSNENIRLIPMRFASATYVESLASSFRCCCMISKAFWTSSRVIGILTP